MEQMTMDIWLDLPVALLDTEWYDEAKTIRYIPYEKCVGKLNYLTNKTWGSFNFIHHHLILPDGKYLTSGSVDLVVTYYPDAVQGNMSGRQVVRKLAGAATFHEDQFPENRHWAAVCKSLCIVNAALVLGRQFGWGLNESIKKEMPPANKATTTINKLLGKNGNSNTPG